MTPTELREVAILVDVAVDLVDLLLAIAIIYFVVQIARRHAELPEQKHTVQHHLHIVDDEEKES